MKKVFFMGALYVSSFLQAQNLQKEQDSISPIALEEVLVQASRAKRSYPVTFSNISKEEIKQKNFGQQIPVLMNHLPNVVSHSDDGVGFSDTFFYVRGSDIYRTNVTINGIPYNDAESQGTFWSNLSDFASSAQNIQLQRGVGTSTNGAGAFGASLNILTDEVSEKSYAEIGNFFGSYHSHKHYIKFSTGKINDVFEVSGRFSKLNSDGYIDRAFTDAQSYFLQGNYKNHSTLIKAIVFGGGITSYLAYKGIDASTLKENRRYNPAGEYYDSAGNMLFYDNETNVYQQNHAQLHWSERWSDHWTTNLAFHYTKGAGHWEQMDNWGDARGNFIIQWKMANDFYGTTFSSNYKKDNFDLIFGGAANIYKGRHFDEVLWTELIPNPYKEVVDDVSGRKKELSFFAKASWEFIPKWELFADVQYRKVNFNSLLAIPINESLDFFNPKAGISYQFNKNNHFYFSYAKASKEPNRSDYKAYAEDLSAGNTEVVLPKEEKVNDFELGWRFLSNSLKINMNAYYMGYTNQLVLTGDISRTGYPLRKNSGDSFRAGIEFDAVVKLTEKWQIMPNFSFSRNKNINYRTTNSSGAVVHLGDTDISFSPNLVFGNTISFSPIENFQIDFISKYVGERYITNENEVNSKLESYFVHHLSLNYKFFPKKILKSIDFSLSCNNLFNQKIVSHGRYKKQTPYYFPMAETNALAGVILNF